MAACNTRALNRGCGFAIEDVGLYTTGIVPRTLAPKQALPSSESQEHDHYSKIELSSFFTASDNSNKSIWS